MIRRNMEEVKFTYRNYKGENEERRVIPLAVSFRVNPAFGYQPGWFLIGFDIDKNAERHFQLDNIVLPDNTKDFRLSMVPGEPQT